MNFFLDFFLLNKNICWQLSTHMGKKIFYLKNIFDNFGKKEIRMLSCVHKTFPVKYLMEFLTNFVKQKETTWFFFMTEGENGAKLKKMLIAINRNYYRK